MALRDRGIGWSTAERVGHLQFIVNHRRFLILPWVRLQGLAGKTLARCTRPLPEDWQRRDGDRPLWLETLVDARRFAGTCYQAANWILLGQTPRRGRMDRGHQADGSARQLVFDYPLCPSVQPRLRQTLPPRFSEPETHRP